MGSPSPRPRGLLRTAIIAGAAAFATALSGLSPTAAAAAPADIDDPSEDRSVTFDEGTNFAVAAAPDGNVVMDLHNILFQVPADGGEAEELTDVLVEAARPDVADDGRIAFQAYSDGQYHIWVADADGSDLRQLTDGEFDHREPRWSSDGTEVVFSSDRGGSYDIWSVDTGSQETTRWTDDPGEEFEPTWHPDGRQVGYIASDRMDTDDASTRIEAVNDSGGVRTLVESVEDASLHSPSWAPAGERIAFVQQAEDEANLMVASEGTQGTAVTSDQDVFVFTPDWIDEDELLYSADGKVRRTTVDDGTATDVPFTATISIADVDVEYKDHDFDDQQDQQIKGILTPTLSPDGQQIAFVALNDLWVMPIDGTPERITDDENYETDPSWSRDGRYLAYSSDRDGTQDIYIRDIATGQEQQVTSLPGAEVAAAFSPDGAQLAFQNQEGATYVTDRSGGEQRQVVPSLFGPGRPTWSADGSTIALAAVNAYSTRYREGTSQVLTVDVATGEQRFHPPGEEHASLSTRGDDGPVWSPDGEQMAFVVDSTLRVMPVAPDGTPTGPAREVSDEAADAPTWNGDSSQLLYLSNGNLRLADLTAGTTRTIETNLRYAPERGPGSTVIRAGAFWDGVSQDLQHDVDILVEDNRIRTVLPQGEQDPSQVADRVIDAADLTVMPGLWDAHVHQQLSSRFWGDRMGRLNLAFGVTSTLSVGDQVYRAIEDRESLEAGERLGPRFFATGEPIDGSRVYYNFMRPTTSDEQLELELTRASELDYDYLKTYVRLPADRMQVALDAAHDMGIPSGSHYLSPGLLLGQDATTHLAATQRLGYARTETATGNSYADVPALYGQGNRVVTTTLFTEDTLYGDELSGDPRLDLIPSWEREELLEGIEENTDPPSDPSCETTECKQVRTFAAIAAQGGTVVTGTDSPLDNPGLGVHANLRMLVAHGWEPYDALRTATSHPADYLGVSEDLGTLESGKVADLIMVEGDPLEQIKDAMDVRMTMRNGTVFTTEELREPFTDTPAS